MENAVKFYILMRANLGFNVNSIHTDFSLVLGNHAPSYETVNKWAILLSKMRRETTAQIGGEQDASLQMMKERKKSSRDESLNASKSLVKCNGRINHLSLKKSRKPNQDGQPQQQRANQTSFRLIAMKYRSHSWQSEANFGDNNEPTALSSISSSSSSSFFYWKNQIYKQV